MSAKHDKDNTQIEDEIKKMWSVPSVSCLVLADAGCWKQEGDVTEQTRHTTAPGGKAEAQVLVSSTLSGADRGPRMTKRVEISACCWLVA